MVAILLTICLSTPGGVSPRPLRAPISPNPFVGVGQQQSPTTSPTSAGRVVVTLAVEGVRVPSVTVSLRSVDGNIVVGQTTSDSIGQVTFPGVPSGRYVVRAVRDGFVDSESSPFDVRAGETEQVLVENRPYSAAKGFDSTSTDSTAPLGSSRSKSPVDGSFRLALLS